MVSRMYKYKNNDSIPTRSDKNKELYKQIYNAYDEFENLIVPSNAREINPSELKKEITSRQDYRKQRDYEELTNSKSVNNDVTKREKKHIEEKNEVYDINELLDKAIKEEKKPELKEDMLSNSDYLKKLKLDNRRTNIEQVKELYEDIQKEDLDEDESLMKTANLSLEILSDLKGDNDKTVISAPIKDEEVPDDFKEEEDFYSNTYKFSKKDFEGKEFEEDDEEEDDDDDESKNGSGKFFFKILMLIFGILLIVLILIYFINYFNRV